MGFSPYLLILITQITNLMPLRPVFMNNTCPLRFTAAAGTNVSQDYLNKVISLYSKGSILKSTPLFYLLSISVK